MTHEPTEMLPRTDCAALVCPICRRTVLGTDVLGHPERKVCSGTNGPHLIAPPPEVCGR